MKDVEALLGLALHDVRAEAAIVHLLPSVLGTLRPEDARRLCDRALAATRPGLVEVAVDVAMYEATFDAELDRARTAEALHELARRIDARIVELERRAPPDPASRRSLDELRADALDASARLTSGQLDAGALRRQLEAHPARDVLVRYPLR